MLYLEGKFRGEQKYTTDKGFEVHNIIVEEEGRINPRVVSAYKGFVAPKVDSTIKLVIGCNSWNDKIRKFTGKGVKFYSLSPKKL